MLLSIDGVKRRAMGVTRLTPVGTAGSSLVSFETTDCHRPTERLAIVLPELGDGGLVSANFDSALGLVHPDFPFSELGARGDRGLLLPLTCR